MNQPSFKSKSINAGVLLSLLLCLSPIPVAAMCGTGNPPSYDDITGIHFERYECKVPVRNVKSDCVSYLVFVSNWDHQQKEVREYEQFIPTSEAGAYVLNVNASELIDILREYKFFELNPANIGGADFPYTILAVKHCSIVTRISQPAKYVRLPGVELDRATQALFDALNTLIEKAPKLKVSEKPRYREENWDGWL